VGRHDAAKATAESFRQIVELQKQTIVVNVKTSLFTLLLAKRLVTVNAALDRALLNLRSAQGFYSVGTQPKSFVTRAEVDVANAREPDPGPERGGPGTGVLNTAMGIAISAPTEVKDILAYELVPGRRRGPGDRGPSAPARLPRHQGANRLGVGQRPAEIPQLLPEHRRQRHAAARARNSTRSTTTASSPRGPSSTAAT
jgi:hypothetical protein